MRVDWDQSRSEARSHTQIRNPRYDPPSNLRWNNVLCTHRPTYRGKEKGTENKNRRRMIEMIDLYNNGVRRCFLGTWEFRKGYPLPIHYDERGGRLSTFHPPKRGRLSTLPFSGMYWILFLQTPNVFTSCKMRKGSAIMDHGSWTMHFYLCRLFYRKHKTKT